MISYFYGQMRCLLFSGKTKKSGQKPEGSEIKICRIEQLGVVIILPALERPSVVVLYLYKPAIETNAYSHQF